MLVSVDPVVPSCCSSVTSFGPFVSSSDFVVPAPGACCVVVVVLKELVGQGGEQSDDLQEHLGQGTPSSEAFTTLLGVWKSTWKV